jgi:hypothetical protein
LEENGITRPGEQPVRLLGRFPWFSKLSRAGDRQSDFQQKSSFHASLLTLLPYSYFKFYANTDNMPTPLNFAKGKKTSMTFMKPIIVYFLWQINHDKSTIK